MTPTLTGSVRRPRLPGHHRRRPRSLTTLAGAAGSGLLWTEFGHNVPEQALRERRASLDALTADDVAQALVYAFAQHPRVLVEEILVRPVKQVAP